MTAIQRCYHRIRESAESQGFVIMTCSILACGRRESIHRRALAESTGPYVYTMCLLKTVGKPKQRYGDHPEKAWCLQYA